MDIAMIVDRPGGPEVLRAAPRPAERPGPGEVRIRQEAIGVNFIDVYFRSGLYPLPPQKTPGVEGAGVIEEVGEGVVALRSGDRVAYAGPPVGAYASARLLPEGRAIKLPPGISARSAAATLVKGLTAHMLLTRTYKVGEGSLVLIHAAAGGLGTVLTLWAKRLGAIVVGVVGNEAKAKRARENGADHVVVGRETDLAAAVAGLTSGRGVDYAIDGVGGTTLQRTLSCVRKFGVVASIGQSAGPIPPLAVEALGPSRALSLARPSVMAYAAEDETYPAAVAAVFEAMAAGVVARIGAEYPLVEARRAHVELEAGRSVGSLLLIS